MQQKPTREQLKHTQREIERHPLKLAFTTELQKWPSIYLLFCTFSSSPTISFFSRLSTIGGSLLTGFGASPHIKQLFLLSCFLRIFSDLFWPSQVLVELMSGLYNQISSPATARAISPNINMRANFDIDSQYLTELLAEHQKLGPFIQVLPLCSRLLNQEILRVSGKSGMLPNQGFSDFDRMQFGSPSLTASSDITPNFTGWNSLSHERLAGIPGMNIDWQTSPVISSSHIVKRILRLDIPKDSYPNFNFVGRLLGPRGNSLKRVEATTGCRVFIRGKGSIKDLDKEELLRGRPGYEHLNDPLHILIEAELPANIVEIRLRQAQEIIEELLKPVDESQDFYKRQQLRELAMLNSNYREESPQLSGSVSPFTSNEIKRAKTDQ